MKSFAHQGLETRLEKAGVSAAECEWAFKVEIALFEAGFPNAVVTWFSTKGVDGPWTPYQAAWDFPDNFWETYCVPYPIQKIVPPEVFAKAAQLAGPYPESNRGPSTTFGQEGEAGR